MILIAINISHNEERYDRNIELTPDTSQIELTSPDVDGAAENSNMILTAPDGTKLLQITAGDVSASRHPQQNI